MRTRLNVLYVGTLPPHQGGSAISCSQILLGLAGLGHRIRALGPMTEEAFAHGDPFADAHPELEVERFFVPHFQTDPSRPDEAYRRLEKRGVVHGLKRMIEAKRPDVVVIGRETFAWHVPPVARAEGLPSVLFVRGGTTSGLLQGNFPLTLAGRLIDRFRQADLAVAPAQHMADALRERGVERIEVVPNAIDVGQFGPGPRDSDLARALGISDGDVVVAHVSNMKGLKRALDVVHSAARALERNPRLFYLVVGDGPSRPELEDACAGLGVTDRFRFTGWVDYPGIPDRLRLADIVAVPSESEGLARIYLETQATARTLVASDIAAAHEVVVEGETGLLFPVGDHEELAAKTLVAAGDPALRARIGRAARRQVEARHSLPSAVAAYETLLEGVVARARVTA